jgi:tripartite-type tricarboxylate transporter receptor subunit TctC
MDVSARLVAPYLQKAVGASAVKVVDVKGAGGVIGFNQLWGSPNDGYTFGYGSMTTLITTSVVGGSSVKYDAAKFVYIGRSALLTPRVLAVSAKSGITTLAQLQAAPKVVFSAQGFNDDFYTAAAVSQTLGLKAKYVTGFDSAAAELEALGSGSTTAIESSIAEISNLFKSGLAKPVVMINDEPVKGYESIPLWTSLVSADQKPLADAFQAVIDFGRSFIGPPGFPAEGATTLSAGLQAALQDPDLLGKMAKLGVPTSYMSAADEQSGVEKSVATLKADVGFMTDAKNQVQK